MIDKNNFPMRLEGKSVILEEIQPKFFPYVIEWRNDPELNKFLNQPYKLTLELEQKWYEEIYLNDDTQAFWIAVDKQTEIPFATQGWTKLDRVNKKINGGRLMLGNPEYAKKPAFMESFFVVGDFIYSVADTEYIHVVKDNKKALRINKMMGFIPNTGQIQSPQELFVNGMEQIEFYRTKEIFLKIRKKFLENLNNSLFS